MEPELQSTPAVLPVNDPEALTATILAAVKRQLTKYFTAMQRQTDEARQATEHFQQQVEAQLPALQGAIERQRTANDAYQQALQTALEERLSEFANHQHWRLNDLEDRVAALPTGPSQEALGELRQTLRDDLDRAFSGVYGRIDDLVHVQQRLDEQASGLVQHVNDTTAALAKRMDEGDERITLAVEQRLVGAEHAFEAALADVETQVGEHTKLLLEKLDAADARVTDRMLALEARINEEQGTRLANIEATIGRTAAGFDEAMIAVNQRVLELENHIITLGEAVDSLSERAAKFDEQALEELKSQMSSAIGEAMLVRIELDRVVGSMEDKLDKQALKVAEVEAKLDDQMDVDTAVQLERIDELERAMAMLDPNKINAVLQAGHVIVDGALPAPTGAMGTGPITGTVPRVPPPVMTLKPRLGGADGSTQDVGMQDGAALDTTYEQESTYSPY